MQVKEILTLAAQGLGREDLIEALESEERTSETEKELACLLRGYNFVENEIALEYFPLKAEETFACEGGRLAYTLFAHAPVNVHKVTDEAGKNVDFTLYSAYLSLPAETKTVHVIYSYAPEKKDFGDESAFSGSISARLMSHGVASEFLLANGRYTESDLFQKRYHDALRAAGILRRRLSMHARRWV